MQPSHRVCKPALFGACTKQDKLEGCDRKGIWRKNGRRWMWGHRQSGRGGIQTEWWCICLGYLSLHHKFRRWQAVMEEVDKGCSQLWVTVGTMTRIAGILIHSWSKALAVNLSRPFGRLQLCGGIIGSKKKGSLIVGMLKCNRKTGSQI